MKKINIFASKLSFVILVFVLFSAFTKSKTIANSIVIDDANDIVNAFKSGNAINIAKFFNNNVSINLNNAENLYSKQQAEVVLKDFFVKNVFKQFTVLHQGQSKDGAQYLMGSMITSNGTFRIYSYFKKNGEQYVIKEIRVE